MFQKLEWMDLEFLKRTEDSKKGDSGRIAAVGGSRDYPSTPSIVGFGALRAGADLIDIVAPEKSSEICASQTRDFIRTPTKGEKFSEEDKDRITESVRKADCAVIGNGVSGNEGVRDVLFQVIEDTETPLVIDADMLVPELRDMEFSGRKVVLTPHRREFKRIYEEPLEELAPLKEQVKKAARVYDATVLLKGRYDIVSDGESVFANRTGTPYMTKGGTGDVLAGIVSTFLPLTRDVKAAFLGCYINGKAGESAFETYGPGFDLEELGENISLEMQNII